MLHKYYITKDVEFKLQGMDNTKDTHELYKENLAS